MSTNNRTYLSVCYRPTIVQPPKFSSRVREGITAGIVLSLKISSILRHIFQLGSLVLRPCKLECRYVCYV